MLEAQIYRNDLQLVLMADNGDISIFFYSAGKVVMEKWFTQFISQSFLF